MQTGIRLIAQCYNITTGEMIEEAILHDGKLPKAETLKQLGYLHIEQINLLQKAQDFKVKHQIVLNTINKCPACGSKTSKHGTFKSNFFAALTDHKVTIQRTTCKCGWSSPSSIDGIYGHSMHPDLLEKQATQGSKESYEKSSKSLNAESAGKRSINSHSQIYKSVKYVGELLEEVRSAHYYSCEGSPEKIEPAAILIANIDGGHIKARGDARSFEAMVAKVYRPENLTYVNKNHNAVISKTFVASAKADEQQSIKKLFKSACVAQGMMSSTKVTCLADGAKNCWSIAHSIENDCQQVECLLDWFHMSMKFKNVGIPFENKELFERAKWNLWHGKPAESLALLDDLSCLITDSSLITKIEKLRTYINNNQNYIVNYDERKRKGLVFTSNEAEATVNTLINDRQKGKQKMLWTREGAHNVLQIKSSVFSGSWTKDWKKLERKAYKKAA